MEFQTLNSENSAALFSFEDDVDDIEEREDTEPTFAGCCDYGFYTIWGTDALEYDSDE